MFTGIVEEVGTVVDVVKDNVSSSFIIRGSKVIEDTNIGDSICTDGVCLTITRIDDSYFHTDVMAETLRMSSLSQLQKGSKVNLERALSLNSRLGGHIVSGHIDGTGTIKSLKNEGNAVWIAIDTSSELLKYMINKGSITINGISLTIAKLNKTGFHVSIIPHTLSETALLLKKTGEKVNIECDVIGKYVERLLGFNKENDISLEFLRENGFV